MWQCTACTVRETIEQPNTSALHTCALLSGEEGEALLTDQQQVTAGYANMSAPYTTLPPTGATTATFHWAEQIVKQTVLGKYHKNRQMK